MNNDKKTSTWTRRQFLTRGGAILSGLMVTNTMGGRWISHAMGSQQNNNGPGLTIVKDGTAKALIVISSRPTEAAEEGAALLADMIRRISGAQIPVISERELRQTAIAADGTISPLSGYSAYVLVGSSDLAGRLGFAADHLGSGGILMKTRSNTLALLGRDDEDTLDPRGTYYAVVTFLEELLDVRHVWPGELGRVVPKNPTITVPAIDVSYTPPLRQRGLRYGGLRQELSDTAKTGAQWLGLRAVMDKLGTERYQTIALPAKEWHDWHRLGGRLHRGSIGGHAFLHLWDKYGKDHPEWFAMNHAGSRDQSAAPDRARLCKSNPGLIKAIAAEKIEEINRRPGSAVSLSPNDGGPTAWCICDNCRALDDPGGRKIIFTDTSRRGGRQYEWVSLTDRMVYFWNAIVDEVTKVHPDAKFVVDAYSVYKDPPISRRLRPNVVVRSVLISYYSDEYRRLDRENWDGWRAANALQFWRPNYLHDEGFQGNFVGYTTKLADDFRYFTDTGMEGTDIDSILNHWSTHGLIYYVTAKLLWNPYADVDQLVDDYCRAAFGPGAAAMKEYFAVIEEVTNEFAANSSPDARHEERLDVPMVSAFTPEAINRLERLIDEAANEAARTPGAEDAAKRIAFVRRGFEWSALSARLYRLAHQKRASSSAAEHIRIQEEAKPLLDEWYWLLMDIHENDPLALNVYQIAAVGTRILSHVFGWVRPPLEGEREPYKYVVDTFEGPKEVAWFGSIYRPLTIDQSEGWEYKTDQPGDFFGDSTRKTRKGNTTEYLVWETRRIDEFELIIYTKDPSIENIISVSGSVDQTEWKDTLYTVDHIETSPAGWHKLVIYGNFADENTAYTRLTLKEYDLPTEIQLGSMTLRLLN